MATMIIIIITTFWVSVEKFFKYFLMFKDFSTTSNRQLYQVCRTEKGRYPGSQISGVSQCLSKEFAIPALPISLWEAPFIWKLPRSHVLWNPTQPVTAQCIPTLLTLAHRVNNKYMSLTALSVNAKIFICPSSILHHSEVGRWCAGEPKRQKLPPLTEGLSVTVVVCCVGGAQP